jgi:hypothetical protein
MSAGRMVYLTAAAVCLATQAMAAEFARAAKLDANRATLGGLAAELFFPRAFRYRRSLIRNIIAVTWLARH